MSDYEVLNKEKLEQALRTSDPENRDQLLLEWASSSQLVERIEVSTWKLQNAIKTYRVNAKIRGVSKSFIGTGRSPNKANATCKALAEAIERMTMFEVYSQDQKFKLEGTIKENQGLEINNSKTGFAPIEDFKTSSGWASHWDLRKSLLVSMEEALERHILLYTFLNFGWEGFYVVPNGYWQGFDLYSAFSRVSVANYSGGICIARHSSYPGMLFGYLVESTDKIGTSHKWQEAFFEMYDAYDVAVGNSKKGKGFQFNATDIGKYGNYWLSQEPPTFNMNDNSMLVTIPEAQAFLRGLDVSKRLRMNFPYFVTFVGFGDLVPLFFVTQSNSQLMSYLSEKLGKKIRLEDSAALWHPVL